MLYSHQEELVQNRFTIVLVVVRIILLKSTLIIYVLQTMSKFAFLVKDILTIKMTFSKITLLNAKYIE